MKYAWKQHSRYVKADPQMVGEQLEKMADMFGAVTPELLVRRASSSHHPLHRLFTWNNAKAATLHRLNEARYVLRMLTVEVADGEEPVEVRAYLAVSAEEREQAYYPVSVIREAPDLRASVLQQARRELVAAQSKLSLLTATLNHLEPMVRQIGEMVEALDQEELAEAAV